jgi:integrase
MPRKKPPETCAQWIEAFHQDYLDRGGTESNWHGEYWKILKTLPQRKPLTAENLHKMVIRTKVNTRQRKRAAMVAGAIAKFAKIDYDPKPYRGKYSATKSIKTRTIPEDDLIVKCYGEIENPGYRWIFAMMATYGLRPHECFRLDFDQIKKGELIIQVQNDTKTGARDVWAFHPEWFEQFEIAQVELPPLDLTRTNESLGRSISKYFRVYHPLPFTPYDLRHRWAIRSLEYGLADALSAEMMGHSLDVHNKVYQKWIGRLTKQRAYGLLLSNPNRPRPPKM